MKAINKKTNEELSKEKLLKTWVLVAVEKKNKGSQKNLSTLVVVKAMKRKLIKTMVRKRLKKVQMHRKTMRTTVLIKDLKRELPEALVLEKAEKKIHFFEKILDQIKAS